MLFMVLQRQLARRRWADFPPGNKKEGRTRLVGSIGKNILLKNIFRW